MHTESAVQLSDRFKKGEISAQEICQHFLQQIQSLDSSVGAFLTLFPEKALDAAAKLDARRKRGEKLGRLAGVPIAIKDLLNIRGELTTCASKFLTNFRAPFDATAVRLLLEEDAIIIGKTNLDEFAMGSSTEHSAIKRTNNPWNLRCTPGGSSGGSAAAVAARFAPLALGTDTGGSIRQPASLCGTVGFKPTYGRVSRFGMVAFGSSLDQIGPFANTVEDIALTMEVIGRHCKKDSTSIQRDPDHFLEGIKKPINGMKIGVPWHFLEGLEKDTKKAFDAAIDTYKRLGAQIVEVDLSFFKYAIAVYYIVATAEASTNLSRFDGVKYGVRSQRAKTLEEVYDLSRQEGFGDEVKRRIMLGTFVLSSGYQDAYYKKAQKVRTLIIQQCKDAFKKCDLIATPTSPFPAFEIGSIQDPLQMYLADIYTIPANLAGLPSISIPAGFSSDGKPIGLQLMGAQLQDVRVCQAANAFEKATDFNKKLPSLVRPA